MRREAVDKPSETQDAGFTSMKDSGAIYFLLLFLTRLVFPYVEECGNRCFACSDGGADNDQLPL